MTEITKYGICRFKNLGNTCYMNSIIHILQQIPVFTKFLFNNSFEDQNTIIYNLYILIKTSHENEDFIIKPSRFKSLLGEKNDMWDGFNQHDSQEFLNYIITTIQEEIGKKNIYIPGCITNLPTHNIYNTIININALSNELNYKLKEYSPLIEIFNGTIHNIKKCKYCGCEKNNFELFTTLQLPISNQTNNIYDCFDNIIKTEQLDKYNKLNCDLCGLKTQGYSNTLLWNMPKVLILHFKRFLVNDYGIPIQKLSNNISYPIKNLDLTKYINPISPYYNKNKYDLIAINLHHGILQGGHYLSYVKSYYNNKWYKYNDENPVVQIKQKNILQDPNAYMLFYYRH